MKKVSFAALTLVLLAVFGLAWADDKPKADDKDKGKVNALAPHPLDKVFENATTIKQVNEGLLNDDLFKKAVTAALQAKKDQEQKYKDNPKLVGPSPAQAARVKFLEVLKNENSDDKPKDDKEKK
jgi:hypothetical protein